MTTNLATIPQLRGALELYGPDREAAEAVASGLRDSKAGNTRRAYASAWRRFQAWGRRRGMLDTPHHPRSGGPIPGPPGGGRQVHGQH